MRYENKVSEDIYSGINEISDYYFYKILDVDLVNDTYRIIKAPQEELDSRKDYIGSGCLSEYFAWFASSEYCYHEDTGSFMEFCNIDNIRQSILGSGSSVSFCYRRIRSAYDFAYIYVRMEVIPQEISDHVLTATLLVRRMSEGEYKDFCKTKMLTEELMETNRKLKESERSLEEALAMVETKNNHMIEFYNLFYKKIQELNENNSVENVFKYLVPDDFMPEYRKLINAVNKTIEVSNTRVKNEHSNLKIFNNIINSGMWSAKFDCDSKIKSVRWSSEFRKMLGYSDEIDFPDKYDSWCDSIHPEDRDSVVGNLFQTLAECNGKTKYNDEYRLRTKSGDYKWFRASGEMNRNKSDKIICFLGLFIDITDIKKSHSLEKENSTLQTQITALIGQNSKDEMTGCLSKSAYSAREKELQLAIHDKVVNPFAIVSVDINGLKVINDSFGHEKGDIYLRNCVKTLTDVFGCNNVYRTGGDEFVVVLVGVNYTKRDSLYRKISNKIEKASEQQRPEDRVSLAIGMAEYIREVDTTVRHVYEKADEAMYANKRKIKNNIEGFPRMWGHKYEQAVVSGTSNYFEVNLTQETFMSMPVFYKDGKKVTLEDYPKTDFLDNFLVYKNYQERYVQSSDIERYRKFLSYNNLLEHYIKGDREIIQGFDGVYLDGTLFRFRIVILLAKNDYTGDLMGLFLIKKTNEE